MHSISHSPRNTAFSLVELSIVLVILGLLIGGILAGQSLIRASELRSISSEYHRWNTAVYAFRDKYLALPGDFADATRFWQRQSTALVCATNSDATHNTAGVCDGNSDGIIGTASAGSAPGEFVQLWRHLSLAGLIEGSYSGITGTGGGMNTVVGGNVPASRYGKAGWNLRSIGGNSIYTTDAEAFQIIYANAFHYGAQSAGYGVSVFVLTPADTWNLDQKIDDGRPAYGRLLAYGMECVTPVSGGNTNANFNQVYNLSDPTVKCGLLFPKAF